MTPSDELTRLRDAIDAKRNDPTRGDGSPCVVMLVAYADSWSVEARTAYGVRLMHTGAMLTANGAIAAAWLLVEGM